MPCVRELPVIDKISSFYKPDQLATITITTDQVKTAKTMMAKAKSSLPVLRDEKGETFKAYRAFAIPSLYLIDQQGKIYANWVGGIDDLEKTLGENIRFLLSSNNSSALAATAAREIPDK